MDIDDLSALLGEDIGAESGADIWVVVPALDAGHGARLLGESRRLADGLGCYVQAVVGSTEAAARAIALGADRAHVAGEAVAYLAGQRPEFVLFLESESGEAAAYAQRAGAGLVSGVRGDLQVEEGTRALVGAHPVYGGEYAVERAVTSAVKVATVVEDTLPLPFADAGRSGETIVAEAPAAAEPRVSDLGPVDFTPPAWRPLAKARLIVSVGRGLRDEAGVALARQLAQGLGAAFAGDRSALSSGWIDEDHEVGVTGQEVAPELYLALGILGDTMHNAAMTGARRVIAVHAQPDAPIFKAADTAIVAEPARWVGLVLEALGNSAPDDSK